jgi:hypothetical protein
METFKVHLHFFKPSGKWHSEKIDEIKSTAISMGEQKFPYDADEIIEKKYKKDYWGWFVVVTPYYKQDEPENQHVDTTWGQTFPTLVKL